ncbi:MAG: class I adenylate cyclase [Spirochaetes bacterium]|jgi:adenylate cyclase class 1|nr:class I adenylate cyclase [Spirochaetota bacterium]
MSYEEKIKENLDKFTRFNNTKLERFNQLISNTNVKRVIHSIPILFSVNHKKLPGYIEGNVPLGVAYYEPDDEAKKYLQGKFHVMTINPTAENPFVQMVAVMGSVGTIAYTKKSDFDLWVCINKKDAKKEMLENFAKKAEAIQNWAMDEGKTEVHIFINDIENVKHNIFAEDKDEAFGSTVGPVLKDEFFRSSIIIAGKVPFWWTVPQQVDDAQYDMLYGRLEEEFREKNFIDLGNLYSISKEDFLGAALFQLIKSLGNPFKSIIKIGLLEKYLFGSEDSPLLSQKIKSNIMRDNFDDKIIDSYVLMFEEVYGYYEKVLEDKNLLKILRQNLYLKIDPQLTKYSGMKKSQGLPYKVLVMFNYIKEWAWTAKEIKELDDFENWDYKKIMHFWNQVKKFMLLSYQKISQQLPSMNLAQKISENDFNLLSRKIKAQFSTETDKIDNYVTFKDTPNEAILYIEPVNKDIDKNEWSLFKRNTSSKDRFVSTTLRTEHNLLKLMAWTAINQIYHPTFSRLKIQSGYIRINQNQAVEVMTKISALFMGKTDGLKNEYFLNPAFNLVNMVIINFNMENADSIQTVNHLYMTSWGESFLKEYRSESDLIMILENILKDGIVLKREFAGFCEIFSPEPFKKLYKEIEALFKIAYEFMVKGFNKHSLCLTSRLGSAYVTISRDGDRVSVRTEPNIIKVLTSISIRPKANIVHKFEGEDQMLSNLEDLYSRRKSNAVTVIYEERGPHIILYVINEKGNIFTFIRPAKFKEEIIIQMYQFCRDAISQANAVISKSYLQPIIDIVTVYRLTVDKFGKRSYDNESKWVEEIYLIKYKSKISSTADISIQEGGSALYRINLPGGSIGPVPLNQIQMEVSGIDKGGDTGTILCGINVKGPREKLVSMGTTLHFMEKYRLEFLIDGRIK